MKHIRLRTQPRSQPKFPGYPCHLSVDSSPDWPGESQMAFQAAKLRQKEVGLHLIPVSLFSEGIDYFRHFELGIFLRTSVEIMPRAISEMLYCLDL